MLHHSAYRRAVQLHLRANVPPLPVDLYRPILEHLRGERDVLRNLALVDKSMWAEATLLLYERIQLSTGKILALVKSLRADSSVAKRIRSLSLDLSVGLNKDTHALLRELLSGLTELVELCVICQWRPPLSAMIADYGSMLDSCPTTKLSKFKWDSMCTAHVLQFILRQDMLEELELTDSGVITLGRQQLPASSLPHLSRVQGDARWIVQAARQRPIVSVQLSRTTATTTLELLRVLTNSKGPCSRFISCASSAMSGLYPRDVIDVVQWLPNLLELGDCYIFDPHTMSPDLFLRAIESFTSLERLRIVDNSDWVGGKFKVDNAVRFHQAVPTLKRVEVFSMSLASIRVFIRHDKEIQGGRAIVHEYRWREDRASLKKA